VVPIRREGGPRSGIFLMSAPSLLQGTPLLEEERPSQSAAHEHRPIGQLALLGVVFFNICGSPIGSEGVIAAFGPIGGLSAFLVMALCFSVPQSMVTAELSTAFPYNGGYSLWVQAAWGPFWGIQQSYYSWCSGVVDSAIYPVLLYSCIKNLFDGLGGDVVSVNETSCPARTYGNDSYSYDAYEPGSGGEHHGDDEEDLPFLLTCLLPLSTGCLQEYGIKLGILAIFVLPNYISSALVGHCLTLAFAVSTLPYFALVACALGQWKVANFVKQPAKLSASAATVGFTTLYWNLSGFDCASTIAGEVFEPSKTYPRALFSSLAVILLTYSLPGFAASGADAGWDCWEDGSYVTVAFNVAGSWLALWISITVAVSNWGLFASQLLEDSHQLLGMAEVGLLPRFFATRGCSGTPVVAITVQATIVALMISLDFNSILCIDNFFSSLQALLEFSSVVKLRMSRPEMERPYRIPLGTVGLALFIIPPCLVSITMGIITLTSSQAITVLVGVAGGGLIYIPFFLATNKEKLDEEKIVRRASSVAPSPARGALLRAASSTTAGVVLLRSRDPSRVSGSSRRNSFVVEYASTRELGRAAADVPNCSARSSLENLADYEEVS